MQVEIYTVAELKANFSDILERVTRGEIVGVAFGRNRRVKAYLVSKEKMPNLGEPRRLGILSGTMRVIFGKEWKCSE
ncbi:MAG: hypothetical protein N2035_09910 [Chthoniobacterales bacterium]|nr:hypothetical protein [Chthoniobacterales bacterium]MCX7713955.1 hypothetical protein [Chthoniobacterales bacterium]